MRIGYRADSPTLAHCAARADASSCGVRCSEPALVLDVGRSDSRATRQRIESVGVGDSQRADAVGLTYWSDRTRPSSTKRITSPGGSTESARSKGTGQRSTLALVAFPAAARSLLWYPQSHRPTTTTVSPCARNCSGPTNSAEKNFSSTATSERYGFAAGTTSHRHRPPLRPDDGRSTTREVATEDVATNETSIHLQPPHSLSGEPAAARPRGFGPRSARRSHSRM